MGPETLISASNVYRRYVALHGAVALPGGPVQTADGTVLGALDVVQIRQGQLEVSGWVEAQTVHLKSGPYESTVTPSGPRRPLLKDGTPGPESYTGFHIAVPDTNTPAELQIVAAGQIIRQTLQPPTQAQRRHVAWHTSLQFLAVAARCLPQAIVFMRNQDPAAKSIIKTRLGFETPVVFNRLSTPLFAAQTPPAPPSPGPVTIILPVYNAFSMLADVTRRALQNSLDDTHLIIVEDASSDPEVRPFLRALRDDHPTRITLIEHDTNTGFVGAMNAGFQAAQHRPGHVVALNSDAFVPENWLPRLMAPIHSDPLVATVTPFANDAEIAGIPIICAPLPLIPGQDRVLDAVAQTLDPGQILHDAPTGVGFCMAINRRFLDQIPAFDTAFGRGYGEEVDWCQRARALGGRHVLTAGLFVEHRGGQSFGSDEKRQRIAQNNAIVARRYPEYAAQVRAFIDADPAVSARLALALAYVGSADDAPVEILLAHALGGGAENALQARLRDITAAGRSAVVLRVGGMAHWQIDVFTPAGVISGATDDLDLVHQLLAPVQRRHIVYSCGVGCPAPHALPEVLIALKGDAGTLEVLFHDYFPLSPSYCLLNRDGTFTGLPDPENEDQAHVFHRDGADISLAQWRAAWGDLMAAADQIVVFSHASEALVGEAYPAQAEKITVDPHIPHTRLPKIPPGRPKSGHVIGVLGNIGFQKGAALLSEMSAQLGTDPQSTQIVVIGEFDLNYRIRAGLSVHGPYDLAEMGRLVQHYGIECWLIPSIWPETYSYVTHEALMTGLPVFCGDLGAQADAVRAQPHGHVLTTKPMQADRVLDEITQTMGWD